MVTDGGDPGCKLPCLPGAAHLAGLWQPSLEAGGLLYLHPSASPGNPTASHTRFPGEETEAQHKDIGPLDG